MAIASQELDRIGRHIVATRPVSGRRLEVIAVSLQQDIEQGSFFVRFANDCRASPVASAKSSRLTLFGSDDDM